MADETNGKKRGLNGMWMPIIAVAITIFVNLGTAGWTNYVKSECVSRVEFDVYRNDQIQRRELLIREIADIAGKIGTLNSVIDKELKENDKQDLQLRELEKRR